MRAERGQDVIVSPLPENVKIEPCNEGITNNSNMPLKSSNKLKQLVIATALLKVTQSYRVPNENVLRWGIPRKNFCDPLLSSIPKSEGV